MVLTISLAIKLGQAFKFVVPTRKIHKWKVKGPRGLGEPLVVLENVF